MDPAVPGNERLLTEARRILAAVKESTYSHTTTIDEASGRYDVDCSGFVDYAMSRATPDAFTALVTHTAKRPVASSYVSFAEAPSAQWQRVMRASELVPGDLVAWLEPASKDTTNTGHVMIVAGVVVVHGNEVDVPIIDSTDTPHGATDARTVSKTTGVGTGTIGLIVGTDGAPTAYRWSIDKGSPSVTTTIALAHIP
jgi:hypothetical protein